MSIVRPQRIGSDVRNDNRFATIGSRPTRTFRRSDNETINCAVITLGQAWRSAMPQAISVQEQNGRDNIRQLFFDQLAERVENSRQRITFGDHLEKPFLPT